jgi:hypothetical protein
MAKTSGGGGRGGGRGSNNSKPAGEMSKGFGTRLSHEYGGSNVTEERTSEIASKVLRHSPRSNIPQLANLIKKVYNRSPNLGLSRREQGIIDKVANKVKYKQMNPYIPSNDRD